MRLILGSASPYRAGLLRRLGLPFEQTPGRIDETPRPDEDPAAYVVRLAIAKAKAAAPLDEPALIIGSDQAAVLDGEILGKAQTLERAIAQLRRASGRRVEFLTGLALINSTTGAVQSDMIPARAYFRHLSEASITRYVEHERPLDCAGSIKVEGLGIVLLQRLEGDDPTALIGLPLIRLTAMLAAEGIHLP
ncbi:Maf family protein [Nitrococcus mobilis]|uniref:7-methyl-GTP pyrophosphatase n=1 Tax=Nitrococcus mobilis Nb-231 TaxID=314278 RepID=A4BML4_9GAMM|nr:nucleoside triphosphate pyrophosphatase [Nitrococcus mobilis]EAR23552.1 Maf-like protein [Nitrococcus mobilis Nb-231]